MQKFIIGLFLILFSICEGFSQSKINGLLLSENDNSVAGASVTIIELKTNNILNYDITDSKGFFSISVKTDDKMLQLKVRSLGFKTISKTIENKSQTFKFVLKEEITELKEVVIKTNSITCKGDTINYLVNAFAKQEDRTIADVLKNLPGIEVLNNGKILYQGKPINKYYIEGLDLLEGKYNLANSNLPYKAVTKIQVLKHHQPIKILDSLVYSNSAAINIKLKNKYTFSGQAKLGSGFSPLLWDINLTPMLFSKKKQMLSSYQSNNVGNNVALQLKILTIEDLLEQFDHQDEKQDWLAIQQLQAPNFSEKYWLDNNIHLMTTNYLQKLKKDYELRLNVSYIKDHQQQTGFTKTRFFTANDTIDLFENKYNQLFTNNLETDFSLQKNTTKSFLKNSLQFKGFWDSQIGEIETKQKTIKQNLNNHYFILSNNLKTLFILGKQIATLNSNIGFSKTPQSLIVNPGQFNGLLNGGREFDEVIQNIELKTFYTNNSLGITKGWKAFSFSPKMGFQFEKQTLESKIFTSSTNQISNFENNLNWLHTKLYLKLKTQYRNEKWRLELKTPLYFNNYRLEDEFLQKSQSLKRLTFDAQMSLQYDLSYFWRIGSSASISHHFGTINQIYYNYILKNYHNIQRIDAPLPTMKNLNFSVSFRYINPLKSTFFSLVYSNRRSNNNLLFDTRILDNGAIDTQAVLQNNQRKSQNISTRLSKYFSDFNTNFTIDAAYSLWYFRQILNSENTNIANQNWHFRGKIDVDITNWLNAELEYTFQFSNNQIQNRKNQIIAQQFHKFNLNIYPNEKQYFGVKNEFIKNNLYTGETGNIFTDLVYNFTWKKKNIDFELQLNNIFNMKNYNTINIENYSYLESNYTLRPRQILFKIRFSM